MKIEYGENSAKTRYDEEETAFIDTLTVQQKRFIYRGICTPYDYGYKPRK